MIQGTKLVDGHGSRMPVATTDGLGGDSELSSCAYRQLEDGNPFSAPADVTKAEMEAIYGGHGRAQNDVSHDFTTPGGIFHGCRMRALGELLGNQTSLDGDCGRGRMMPQAKPMRQRGNPNWGKPGASARPHSLSAFEQLVEDLHLRPDQYVTSKELRRWVQRNMESHFVPEYLLKAWNLGVASKSDEAV